MNSFVFVLIMKLESVYELYKQESSGTSCGLGQAAITRTF